MNERIEYLREKARKLTDMPGVYLMKDAKGKVIYVGKAKILKNRVSSYFREHARHNDKVRRMVENVYDFDYIITDSEFEALVLECSQIKQYNPKYNILLKDGKGYHYIHISDGEYPRITAQKQNKLPGEYLGPYTSTFAVQQVVDEVNRLFALPTCSRQFPRDIGRGKRCLNWHIKRCIGVCRGKLSKEEYQNIIHQAVDYIKSGSTQTIKNLTEEMEIASENLEFERAATLRDRIAAIRRLSETQKVIQSSEREQDVIAAAKNDRSAAFCVLKFRGGKLVDKEHFILDDAPDINEARAEFLTRYYAGKTDVPRRIAVDEPFEDQELLQDFLSNQAGRKVSMIVPQRGEQKKLVLMAMNNASEQLSKRVNRTGREVAALDELTRLLGLKSTPVYIEAYDISNFGETGIVAGMVVFENGRPLKSAYKRFALKDMAGPDDYAAMKQVIERRLNRYLEEKESGEGFGRLPDLILLDGGKGHVSTIRPVVEAFGLSIPVYGMVKDDSHRTRAIAADGAEIAINANRSAFTLVSKIQDEVHRFAITYQRKVRQKSSFALKLTEIEGIGEKKAVAIMQAFKTKAALKAASVEEIRKAAKVSVEKAEEIRAFVAEMQ